MVRRRLQDWSVEGLYQPTSREEGRRHASVRVRERKKTRTVLWYLFVVILALVGVVLIAVYLREGGTTGGTASRPNGLEVWRLDSVPVMSIGDSEADPLFEVTGIVITDSHVVIAQESEGTLRFYDRSGSLEKTVGGRGEGPGEYGDLDWMMRVGSDLFTYDRYGREVSRYTLDGQLLGSAALSPPEEYQAGLSALGVFSDGSLLANKWHLPWPTEPLVEQSPITLLLFDQEGRFGHRLLEMAGPELWYEPVGTNSIRQMFRLFGPKTHAAVVDSQFVVVENDSYDIPVYGSDGIARDTLRPAIVPDPTPLRPEEAESARRTLLGSQELGSTRGVVEGMLDAMGLPEHLPPYGRHSLSTPNHHPVTTADGLVWALRYGGLPREGADPERLEWYVFQPGTGQVATLFSPDDVVLVDVAGDLAAVLRRTELDEEIVELRRIRGRPTPNS